MSNPVQDRQAIEAKMEAISRRNPAYQQLCELVGGLLLQTLDSGPDQHSGSGPRVDATALDKGRPLWDRQTLDLDWPRVWDLAQNLARALQERPGGAQVLGILAELRTAARPAEQEAEGPGVLRGILTSDYSELARSAGEDQETAQVLNLVLRLALRPFLLAAAGAARAAVALESWSFGHCPVCGSAPGLAELSGQGGRRTLHCSLCETAWAYPRLQCPFCESQEPGIISYLKAKEEQGLQVDICSRCGQYLKTLDLRELAGPIILPLDDAATWHLDLLARRQAEKGD